MTLSDIAAGLEVTTEQQQRGVAVEDDTDRTLAERLDPFADALPCTPAAAAVLVKTYVGGASVGAAAREANLAPVTGAKTLHLLGERVSPLGPTGRGVVRDWIAGRLSRADALELTGLDDHAFALATFIETHDPLPEATGLVATVDTATGRDPLADARSDADEFL